MNLDMLAMALKMGGGAVALVVLVMVLRWVGALIGKAVDRLLDGFARMVAAMEKLPDSLSDLNVTHAGLREHITDTAATNRHAFRNGLQAVTESIQTHVSQEADRTVYRLRSTTDSGGYRAIRPPSIPDSDSEPPKR